MKNISYIINGVLAVAIIVLFVLFFTSNKGNSADDSHQASFTEGDSVGATLPLAYINIDSIYMNYNFAKDANDRLMKKSNSITATINQKERQLQNEVQDFYKKVQNNAFLSTERAQQEQQRIEKLQTDLQSMAQRLQEEYAREQMTLNAQLADSVRSCLAEFNKTAKYQIIFTNNGLDNIVIADKKYDITPKITTILNARYKPEASK